MLFLLLVYGCAFVSEKDLEDRILDISLQDQDGDGFSYLDDCDDNDASIYPKVWYIDSDNDGYGDSTTEFYSCEDEEEQGASEKNGDCDDSDSDIHPDSIELCDGLDNNCNDEIDEDVVSMTYYIDFDGDGFGAGEVQTGCPTVSYSSNNFDCDDQDARIHPNMTEEPGDGVDSNCDGTELCYLDYDGDGYGSTLIESDNLCGESYQAVVGNDCNDEDYYIHPGSTSIEIDYDGVDQDCDGIEFSLSSPSWEYESFSTAGLLLSRINDNNDRLISIAAYEEELIGLFRTDIPRVFTWGYIQYGDPANFVEHLMEQQIPEVRVGTSSQRDSSIGFYPVGSTVPWLSWQVYLSSSSSSMMQVINQLPGYLGTAGDGQRFSIFFNEYDTRINQYSVLEFDSMAEVVLHLNSFGYSDARIVAYSNIFLLWYR